MTDDHEGYEHLENWLVSPHMCNICGATVSEGLGQQVHDDWHKTIRETINIALQGAWRKIN